MDGGTDDDDGNRDHLSCVNVVCNFNVPVSGNDV